MASKNDVRCEGCGSRLLARKCRWCTSCRGWSHLSCWKEGGNRCRCGGVESRFIDRDRRRKKVRTVEAPTPDEPVAVQLGFEFGEAS